MKNTLGAKEIKFTPIQSGANNLGYRVYTDNAQWFLKLFNSNSMHSSYKQQNEFLFTQALYQSGIHNIAKPIAINEKMHASLFSYIDGVGIDRASSENVNAAINFIKSINECSLLTPLNTASESPDTLQGFADIVASRLHIFELQEFGQEKLNVDFLQTLSVVRERLKKIQSQLPVHWRHTLERNIVSPSDFGFHNALFCEPEYYFIDFEYAGIDTPWKTFSDFFAQPSIPVDIKYAKALLSLNIFRPLLISPNDTLKVFELTLLKWCLIMLNEFLPEVQVRRVFSWNISCLNEQREKLLHTQEAQLIKCNKYLFNIPSKVEELQKVLRENI
ncbi:aminoglycoside phosphotransferase family protein [Pseudoalteromonas sp. MMG005]|uniref:aminoglycoside phosphotransferase family protein n=1 Tax=Pseudoalteromonas sp. MMG005 TaxID=2822682 RepID=UPI001B39FE85|nr:phosphotransferase [Pseudoalteromonas sp. MMG005]